jgi:hypothetical protein
MWDLGIRNIRDGGTDPIYSTATGSGRTTASLIHSKGFDNIWGCTRVGQGSTTTPITWATHEALVLAQVALCFNVDVCDTFSLGNEEEERIGTQSIQSLTRTSNVVTATFSSDHGFLVGDTVIIAGATPSDYNSSSGFTITSVDDSTHFTYTASGVDGSASGTLTAKMTSATFIRLVKATAVAARAIAPNLNYIYTSTETHLSDWITAGITPGVDFDYYGLNAYSSSSTNTATFRTYVQNAYNAFGANVYITEWNLYFNWGTVVSQVPTIKKMEQYTKERIRVLQDVGISRAYFYTLAADSFGVMNYLSPYERRNMFNSLFTERRNWIITTNTSSNIYPHKSISTQAKRKLGNITKFSNINRDKCIDFDQSNSYLTATYPTSFNAANLPSFTIAWRLNSDGYGGGSAGRLLSNVNQQFVEAFSSASGYNCQIWHSGTIASSLTGTGSIKFGVWQCLFMTFDASENYPRLYLDAIECTTSPTSKSGSRGNPGGNTISIGNRSDLVRGYDGRMDDFFVWNKVLSQTEMGKYVNGIIPPGYILGYTMNEASGSVIDQGPSGANGTVSNATQNYTSYSVIL